MNIITNIKDGVYDQKRCTISRPKLPQISATDSSNLEKLNEHIEALREYTKLKDEYDIDNDLVHTYNTAQLKKFLADVQADLGITKPVFHKIRIYLSNECDMHPANHLEFYYAMEGLVTLIDSVNQTP